MQFKRVVHALSSRPILWITIALVVASLLSLAFMEGILHPGCRPVRGRLVDGSRFIGPISGEYVISSVEVFGECPFGEPFGPQAWCTGAYSTVIGVNGSIDFIEYGVVDFSEQVGTNGAVLMMVNGGTGQWEGASGHVVLSGYFHTDTNASNWRYQGDICTP
jgi:hypothetical protein